MTNNLPTSRARTLLEGLGEGAVLDFLGVGGPRKPYKLFTPERQLVFLQYLIRSGQVTHAAAVAGVSYETVRRARKSDKQFASAEEAARALHDDMIRAMILERAEEGSLEETHEAKMVYGSRKHGAADPDAMSTEMVLTKTVRRKSDAMLLAYARSRMAEFRDKGDIIANNASGGVLVVNQAPKSSEDWERENALPAQDGTIEESAPDPEEKDAPE